MKTDKSTTHETTACYRMSELEFAQFLWGSVDGDLPETGNGVRLHDIGMSAKGGKLEVIIVVNVNHDPTRPAPADPNG